MILTSVLAALGQFGDARFRRVLLLGVALTFGLLLGATAGFGALVSYLVGDSITIPFIGEVRWFDDVLSWGSVVLMAVLSTLLMVPVASAITSMFLDTVADAVEDKHYAHLPSVEPVPFGEALRDTVGFLGVLIVANLIALILYILFAPVAPLIFWGLNGFLLGREYFTLAAMRRVGRTQAHVLRRRYLLTIWAAGIVMALPLSVPFLNLIVPILGAATFTHLFHLLTGEAPTDPTSRDPAR